MFVKKRKNAKVDQSDAVRSVGTNQGIKTGMIIELDNNHDSHTYSYDTVQEINQKLNSDLEFITIGDLVLKRKSIISVMKTEEKYKGEA